MLKRRQSNPPSVSPKKSGTPVKSQRFGQSRIAADIVHASCNMSPQGILEMLTTDQNLYKGNVCSAPLRIAPREATTAPLSDKAAFLLDSQLVEAYFEHIGADGWGSPRELYSHQSEAIESILVDRARNICMATSTSSGKSVAFNLPILSEIIRDPTTTTALYLYPTKALTQDQKRVLDAVIAKRMEISGSSSGVVAGILDGDVKEMKERQDLMRECNLVLTNPDMLHYSILPNSRKFASFLARLRFVVIDEAHIYNGAFGSHVASVLRRLRRLIDHFQKGSLAPPCQFISCSATIGNPAEHVSRLVGLECDKLVSLDGSPSGERLLAVWRSSYGKAVEDTVGILCSFISRGVRFICFCRNRYTIEDIVKRVGERNSAFMEKIVAYRAGYSSEDRRGLEQKIFNAQVLGVVSTTALELGMDIGALDVALSVGYPGSVHSLWQQWGRAGRGSRPSLSLLICKEEDIVDSWIAQDSETLLSEPPEDAVVQTDNPTVVKNHLICADIELRMMDETDWQQAREVYWNSCEDPAVFLAAKKEAPFVKKMNFSIRNIEARRIVVNLDNRKIDEMDITQAFFYAFPGAVHTVQGVEYRVMDLSLSTNTATVVRANHDYSTHASDETKLTPAMPPRASQFGFVHRSRAEAVLKVNGFYRIKKLTQKLMDYEALALPSIKFVTTCVWIELSDLVHSDSTLGLGAHGAGHAIYYSACQRLLLSRQSDIKCDCRNIERCILIFDAQNGGLGISEMIFDRLSLLVDMAVDRVERCPCAQGCIRCLLVGSCGIKNEAVHKDESLALLKLIQLKMGIEHGE